MQNPLLGSEQQLAAGIHDGATNPERQEFTDINDEFSNGGLLSLDLRSGRRWRQVPPREIKLLRRNVKGHLFLPEHRHAEPQSNISVAR
jgi:hypothetical protein